MDKSFIEQGFTDNPDIATIEMPLVEIITAETLGMLTTSLNEIHFFEVWTSYAEAYRGSDLFPDEFDLDVPDSLFVARLEIGTPNILKLLAKKEYIVAIATTLGAVLAVPQGTMDIVNGTREAKLLDKQLEHIDIEIKLKELELKEKELDLILKTQKLYENSRISEQAKRHKEGDYPKYLDDLKYASQIIDSRAPITVRMA